MSEKVSKVFDFACANPDYWELMCQAHEPPEVAELEARRREAFNAARAEVQRQCGALLDEVHLSLQAKAKATQLEAGFAKSFKRRSYEKANFDFVVLYGRGRQTWASISVSEGLNGRIAAMCWLGTSARRLPAMLDTFRSVVPEDRLHIGMPWVRVEEPVCFGDDLAGVAKRLVGLFWPGLHAYSQRMAAGAGADTSVRDADDE